MSLHTTPAVTKPDRQHLAKLDAQHIYRLMRPVPIEPIPAPMLPGWLFRKQAE